MPAVIAVVVWLSRYRQSAGFGLYEDDYARIPLAMELTWGQIWKRLGHRLSDPFGGQGRLLHDEFIFMLARLGEDLGGLHAMHAIGCAILLANAILFYFLLKRLSRSQFVAVTGALSYALYPADTTQTFLTHSFGAQPSVMVLLAALHLYLSRWRPLAYLIMPFCLLQYETVFTPFLAAPLLAGPRRARSARRWAAHLAVAGGTLGAVFLMRKFAGEGRVAELSLANMLLLPLQQMTLGTLTSLGAWFAKPAVALWTGFGDHKLLLGGAFAGFAMLFWSLRTPVSRTAGARGAIPAKRFLAVMRRLGWLALAGLLLLVLSYALAFTTQPTEWSGRGTRVHLPGVVGASILFGCLLSRAILWGQRAGQRAVCAAAGALFCTGLAAYGGSIQNSYRIAWQAQRALWTDIVNLCPDLDERTMLLINRSGLLRAREMATVTWSVREVLRRLYVFPGPRRKNPAETPVAFEFKWYWQRELRNGAALTDVISHPAVPREEVEAAVATAEFIVVEIENGRYARRTEPLMVQGRPLPLKPTEQTGEPALPRTKLHRCLILPPGETPAAYVNPQ